MIGQGRYIRLALLGAVVPALVLIGLTLWRTGGVWEYALDDVYIHLAMSEQLARGGYGVNAGEPASASSSILYSYLLAPFAGTAFHVWWPLVLGQIGLVIAALLWGRIMAEAAEEADPAAVWMPAAMALGAPVFMHFPAMSVIGMEHMLHIAATLAVLLGLLRLAWTGQVGALLVLGLVLNPLLRFEGLAILMLGVCVIALAGRPLAAALVLVTAAIPLGLHFWHMSQLGLDWLPNSVNAKAAVAGGGERDLGAETPSRLDQMILSWKLSLFWLSGRMLIYAVLAGGFFMLLARRQITGGYRLIGWMAVLAMLGHLMLGSTAWYYRYEVYVWAFAVGTAVVLVARLRFRWRWATRLAPVALVAAVAVDGSHYLRIGFEATPGGSVAIHAQQRQMGRFVDDFWQAPVAVNDLGHVAFANPHYVLDLWGLANADALEARLRGTDPLWADDLARAYDVKAAMIYDHWLSDAIGPDWQKIATLELTVPIGTLGGDKVAIYATDEDAVARLRAALRKFEPTLPPSARLVFVNEQETTE